MYKEVWSPVFLEEFFFAMFYKLLAILNNLMPCVPSEYLLAGSYFFCESIFQQVSCHQFLAEKTRNSPKTRFLLCF